MHIVVANVFENGVLSVMPIVFITVHENEKGKLAQRDNCVYNEGFACGLGANDKKVEELSRVTSSF